MLDQTYETPKPKVIAGATGDWGIGDWTGSSRAGGLERQAVFVGQVMKATGGKANPKAVNQI